MNQLLELLGPRDDRIGIGDPVAFSPSETSHKQAVSFSPRTMTAGNDAGCGMSVTVSELNALTNTIRATAADKDRWRRRRRAAA